MNDNSIHQLADTIPIFDSDESVLKALTPTQSKPSTTYLAFYNGAVDAIITDPNFISIWIDDWMVRRGLGVFDTLNIVERKPYLADKHFDRFIKSIRLAGLEPPYSATKMQETIFALIAYTNEPNVAVRYWCSPGISEPKTKTIFYAVVTKAGLSKPFGGAKEVTVPKCPIEDEILNGAKFTYNYLAGKKTLALEENDIGYFKSNPFFSVGCFTFDGTLCIPPGSKRWQEIGDVLAELASKELVPSGVVNKVERKLMDVEWYRKNAKELFLISGNY